MAKRGQDRQLTKDDDPDEFESQEKGTFKEADPAKLAGRTFVKVRRAGEAGGAPAPAAAPAPSFNFGVPAGGAAAKAPAPAAGGGFPSFNFGVPAEKVPGSSPQKAAAPVKPSPDKKQKIEAAPKEYVPIAKGGFNAFKIAQGSWECPSCMLTNKKEALQCSACEVPNPSAPQAEKKEAAPAPVGFGFGIPAGGSSATKPAFTFGSNAGGGTGFSFGSLASAADKNAAPAFKAAPGAAPAFAAAEHQGFGAAAAKEMFKDKKAEASGEEGDKLVFKMNCTVYQLKTVEKKGPDGEAIPGSKEDKFVETGRGDLHLNEFNKDGKASFRMVLRMDKTQRLVLNSPLFPGMNYAIQNDKFVRFQSTSLEGEPCIHLLKFKTKADAAEMMVRITDSISKIPK